jgi:hypothetical protein
VETLFVIELVLSLIVVAVVVLKTLRDLQVGYLSGFAAYTDDEQEDAFVFPSRAERAMKGNATALGMKRAPPWAEPTSQWNSRGASVRIGVAGWSMENSSADHLVQNQVVGTLVTYA